MTHSDIYTKFMIEYDKANITSSYPSLTKYEIATILDKAYLALIAQKLTGNNPRKATFEADVKAIEDIRPLVTTTLADASEDENTIKSSNEFVYSIPSDMLYYVSGRASDMITQLVSHDIADRFRATVSNSPWIKNPVIYIENDELRMLVDVSIEEQPTLYVTYIKTPVKFVEGTATNADTTPFELTDSMAEELINLAIAIALENVESTRLQTKLSLNSLES